MRRRSFLASAAAMGAMPLITKEAQSQTAGVDMKITGIELWEVTGDAKTYDRYLDEEYPKGGMVRSASRRNQNAPVRVYLKILTDAGAEGFLGPHDRSIAREVMNARNIIGMDPMAIDTVWHRLVGTSNSGNIMFGVSAITNTLWDLKGKFCNLPVYRLLGGSRKVLNCYATTIGMPINTQDEIAEGAARVKAQGFTGQKWFPTKGPREGSVGFEFNMEMLRTLRETVGSTDEIMIDGLRHWDLPYAMRWCQAAEKYQPRWLEEPFMTSSQTEPLARLRQMTTIPISTGEHNYNRWEFHELFTAGSIDIANPDPVWAGGISELTRICAMASAHGLIVSPHNMQNHAIAHLVASQPESVCPYFEYRHGRYMGNKYFELDPMEHNGKNQFVLKDRAGFGIELDESKIMNMEKIFEQT